MPEATFTKLQIAEQQLHRALKLLLEEQDFLSAITLGGASEEILGSLLEQQGKQPYYVSLKMAFEQVFQYFYKRTPEANAFNELENAIRNGLKHYSSGQPMRFDPEQEAVNILDRAVANYFYLTEKETNDMVRFKNYHLKYRRQF